VRPLGGPERSAHPFDEERPDAFCVLVHRAQPLTLHPAPHRNIDPSGRIRREQTNQRADLDVADRSVPARSPASGRQAGRVDLAVDCGQDRIEVRRRIGHGGSALSRARPARGPGDRGYRAREESLPVSAEVRVERRRRSTS
jgi:hypothetical protein